MGDIKGSVEDRRRSSMRDIVKLEGNTGRNGKIQHLRYKEIHMRQKEIVAHAGRSGGAPEVWNVKAM
jgi:hypothetical protein